MHVSECSCACWAACLIWWQWDSLERKHSLPLGVVRTRAPLCPSSQPSPPSPPCLAASRLREKHCIQAEGSGHFFAESCQQGFGEKSSSIAGLVPSSSPFLVHHTLAAASWALTERQDFGACGGWGLWELELPLPSFPTGAPWCLKGSLSLGPFVSKLKL